ncbi:MAG: fumarylacetoacetate hydrolase family protein, partial [Vicinamibacterales bacterium]
GTFEQGGQPILGLVLRDSQVVDIVKANEAFEAGNTAAAKLAAPADMKAIIANYDSGWKDRLVEIAKAIPESGAPSYVYAVDSLKALPPVHPNIVLNAGGNYSEHSNGIAANQARQGQRPAPTTPAVSAPGLWERGEGDTRENPYLFIKSTSIMMGATDPIVMPRGRENIDFECEFVTVIGKTAKYVPVSSAADYIFGYTIEIDVSDRGGRGDRKMGGSDWLVGKNHDTFNPIGPVIVPKEFLAEPMNTRHTFTLNGEVMQDSNTSRMDHNIHELLSFASNNLTLSPGDMIAGGSPAGTNIERAQPRWMRAGDKAVCTIEGIGQQVHDVVAEGGARSTN